MEENKVRYYLDEILSYLKGEKQTELDLALTASEVYVESVNHIKILDRMYITALQNITETQFIILINKLEKDEFIKKIGVDVSPVADNIKEDKYVLTVEGLLFEGYVEKKRREFISSMLKLVTTLAIAIGTIGLLIWEMRLFLFCMILCD